MATARRVRVLLAAICAIAGPGSAQSASAQDQVTFVDVTASSGVEFVHTVVGGTHLFHASERQFAETIAELRAMGVQRLGVSHCTGMAAAARLAQEFGEVFFYNNTSTVVTFA